MMIQEAQHPGSQAAGLDDTQLLAAAILRLVVKSGPGIGPSPHKIARAARGQERALTVSAPGFCQVLLALEKVYPGLYKTYLSQS